MAPSALDASYYQVLDVPFEASDDEIRQKYHGVVRALHPDRRRPGGNNGEALERFHQVQTAWRCLSDPTRRLLYDLRNFGRSSLRGVGDESNAQSRLLELQKKQAAVDVANMETTLQKVLRREKIKGGILIKKALYGNLRLREERLAECAAGKRTITEADLQGPFVDVTLPVQFLVEQHTIVLQGGGSNSKADLPGFYNPAPLDNELELELYVLYDFKSHLHEIIVGDHGMLSMPLRKHMVQPGAVPRGPFSSANVAVMRLVSTMAERRAASDVAEPTRGALASSAPPHGTSAAPRRRFVEEGVERALKRAVVAYRFASLRVRGPEDATPRELALVALCSGAAALLVAAWSKWGGAKGRGA